MDLRRRAVLALVLLATACASGGEPDHRTSADSAGNVGEMTIDTGAVTGDGGGTSVTGGTEAAGAAGDVSTGAVTGNGGGTSATGGTEAAGAAGDVSTGAVTGDGGGSPAGGAAGAAGGAGRDSGSELQSCRTALTSGSGVAHSTSYRLRIGVGAPPPGHGQSASYDLTLGPMTMR
jgi:hypothetical protein